MEFSSTRITQFYISAKHCRLCSFKQKSFLICSSFHAPMPLQEWFLFWRGTMTSFCKACIRSFPEVLPLPKAQEAHCSSFPGPEGVLSSLSVWLGWTLVAFLRTAPRVTLLPLFLKWRKPYGIMEFAWLFPQGSLWLSEEEESPGPRGSECLEQPHPGHRFSWSVALILNKRH